MSLQLSLFNKNARYSANVRRVPIPMEELTMRLITLLLGRFGDTFVRSAIEGKAYHFFGRGGGRLANIG
jgi:hypothetical protein